MNILYNDKRIYLSQRSDPNKEMYSMWQVPGGKIEEGESSVQAALRETAEETGISLSKKDLTFLFNDSTYNCDVYNTKLLSNQIPQHMEPNKQGPWELFAEKTYQKLAKQKKTTPTHTKHLNEIINSLSNETLVYVEMASDALYGEAEVFGKRVNFLIDSGAVGCILSKKFLDKLGKPIDAATNIKIIDVNGKKTAPLGIVCQVPIKIRNIETTMDALLLNQENIMY